MWGWVKKEVYTLTSMTPEKWEKKWRKFFDISFDILESNVHPLPFSSKDIVLKVGAYVKI